MATATQQATGYKVDVSKGKTDTTVSRQWANRPEDERFLSLSALRAAVGSRKDLCVEEILPLNNLEVTAEPHDTLAVWYPGQNSRRELEPTNWGFQQLCRECSVPAYYVQKLPVELAVENILWGIEQTDKRGKLLIRDNGGAQLRAVTGPGYGRIWDRDVVDAVMGIAGDGTGDTRWKVPGAIDWSTGYYNPDKPITKDSTTLYASDRDVFMFLVDDKNPIEVGKLANGEPDIMFRGFYVWNSEVGRSVLGLATFLLRAVCCNRILWGVEKYEMTTLRHTERAQERFQTEILPKLEELANSSEKSVVGTMQKARETIVARDDDERDEYLGRFRFNQKQRKEILETVAREEGHPAESVYDFVQGVTAFARKIDHQDERVSVERVSAKMLKPVAVEA